MSRKKVLFVISSLSGGGAERVLVNIANQMINDGFVVEIIKTSPKNPGNYGIDKSINVIELPKFNTNSVFKAIKIIKCIRHEIKIRNDFTIISFLSDNNILTILAGIFLPNKTIICERNDPSKNFGNSLLRKVRNFIYLFADWNVFQTEDAKNYFCKHIQKKGTIIPNPVLIPQDLVLPYRGYEGRILAVGRLTKQKNYYMMISAFSTFLENHMNYTLDIYGIGELEDDLKRFVKEKGLENKVIFHGFSEDIYRIMSESTIYVSTSDYEGISNTMIEALALGVPTIVTDCPVGGARLMIDNGVNGFIIPVGDSDALINKLCELADNGRLRNQLSEEARKIREKFNLQNVAKMWERLCE